MASAWGIAYGQDHFVLNQGESADVYFSLQNYVEEDSKRIFVELSGDSQIATIPNELDYYLLPPKTKDHEVIIHLEIPEVAKKEYEVEVNFIAYSNKAGFGLATAKVVSITVDVPDGSIEIGDENMTKELDIAAFYEEIEESEGENNQITGLTILGDSKSSPAIKSLLIGLLLLVGIIGTAYLVRYKQRKRDWI